MQMTSTSRCRHVDERTYMADYFTLCMHLTYLQYVGMNMNTGALWSKSSIINNWIQNSDSDLTFDVTLEYISGLAYGDLAETMSAYGILFFNMLTICAFVQLKYTLLQRLI